MFTVLTVAVLITIGSLEIVLNPGWLAVTR
jgi:hypothetical protein